MIRLSGYSPSPFSITQEVDINLGTFCDTARVVGLGEKRQIGGGLLSVSLARYCTCPPHCRGGTRTPHTRTRIPPTLPGGFQLSHVLAVGGAERREMRRLRRDMGSDHREMQDIAEHIRGD